MPLSAPRGFGAFRRTHPDVSLEEYRLWTCPVPQPEDTVAIRQRLHRLQDGNPLTNATYRAPLRPIPAYIRDILPFSAWGAGVGPYRWFVGMYGSTFNASYGRYPTVVDFIRLTGRRHMDPVLDMHLQNGADFATDERRSIPEIRARSRPDDVQAAGFNILLTYDPLPKIKPSA